MKKLTLIIIVCLVGIVSQAQEHLRFMGIPIEGNIDTFCEKLIKENGLKPIESVDTVNIDGDVIRKLTGSFMGFQNCSFTIRNNEESGMVSYASAFCEGPVGKVVIDKLIADFDNLYGKHMSCKLLLQQYGWRTINGDILLTTYGPSNRFNIDFTDYTGDRSEYDMLAEYDRQTVREICGIPFGASYEDASKVLRNKYGTSSVVSDRNRIVYENKSYAGILFDRMLFLFQSDGYQSFFNGCIFVLEASSLSQAKEKRDRLYDQLSWKYDIKKDTDDSGLNYYYGGNPPISFGRAFIIDIIKYDNSPKTPYAARLYYGPYNYVKEEF